MRRAILTEEPHKETAGDASSGLRMMINRAPLRTRQCMADMGEPATAAEEIIRGATSATPISTITALRYSLMPPSQRKLSVSPTQETFRRTSWSEK